MGDAMIKGIAFSTDQERDLSNLDARLGMIADAGADYAELSLCRSDLISGGRIIADRLGTLKRICARHKLGYTVHGTLGANFMDAGTLAYSEAAVAAMLEICAEIGATVLVHHTGIVPYTTMVAMEQLHAMERDALKRSGDVGAKHGVRIAVETLFVDGRDQYTADPRRLKAEIKAIDHEHVVGTLDFSHCYLHTTLLGQDFREALREFAPVTGHLHVHDSFGRPKYLKTYSGAEAVALGLGDLHLPIGWGDIAWDEIFSELRFLEGTIMTIELPFHFAYEMQRNVELARGLAAKLGR